jgi:hypothetical protein
MTAPRSRSRRLVVLGTVASAPYAGMAWMHMQFVVGLLRLGHDAYYLETTSAWPFDPERNACVDDSAYATSYLARVAAGFGIGERWAYRRSYGDKAWLGPVGGRGADLLAHADAVLNIAGATRLAEEGLPVERLVYVGTDPGAHDLGFANGEEAVRTLIGEHHDCVTYGENIGTPRSPIPALPRLRAFTRQPVLLDMWSGPAVPRNAFTTVGNWRQDHRDVVYGGETYLWSKHHEFLKFIELPRHCPNRLELATGLVGLTPEEGALLTSRGWHLVDAHAFTRDPWSYRDYVVRSRGEFTVAKDLNVRLRSGWFSERSACYLAAGRPVITQSTGFEDVLPTGEGLFAFRDMDDILGAMAAIAADYERHSAAARRIAEECFRAETVLARLLADLGV